MSDELHHYITREADLVSLFKTWQEDMTKLNNAAHRIGNRLGRTPMLTTGITGMEVSGFAMKRTESARDDWSKTPFVVSQRGYLRPRLSNAEGKKLDAELSALGRVPHPCQKLKGIPKHGDDLFGTPGMCLVDDGAALVVSYKGKVKHDERWAPLKQSEFWALREAAEAARESKTPAKAVPA